MKKAVYLAALKRLEDAVADMKREGGASGNAWTKRVAYAAEDFVVAAKRFPHLP